MLYVTTRGKNDVYTPARTLQMDRGSDGGFFVPFRMPVFGREELKELASYKPSQNVANMLNLLLGTKITDWEVEMVFGKECFRLNPVGHKLTVAELWHNPAKRFKASVREICQRLHPDGDIIGEPTDWLQMSVRIAMVLGIMTDMLRSGQVSVNCPINVALPANDFSQVMAVWYARKMGLPIGDIIIGCNENSGAWDLISRGELDTDMNIVCTNTPDSDFVYPPALERLIHGATDQAEAMNFCWSVEEKDTYRPDDEKWVMIRQGMYASVISKTRLGIVIPSVYRSLDYTMDLYTSLGYAALSDYRSKTGDGTPTLLFSENSPLYNADEIASYMHVTVDELRNRVK